MCEKMMSIFECVLCRTHRFGFV